jgi:Holliday junction DNA helicase RuvA
MISQLRGKVAEKQAGKVIVDVGGVGYEVAIPVETYSRLGELGEAVSLHIHTHMRENALSLFGFHNRRDKDLFEKFIDISGVGPRLALTLLSGLSTAVLVTAIRTGDSKTLVRIPGVGKKTGQRIILELRDKLAAFDGDEGGADGETAAVEEDVISALTNLGCSPESARRGVRIARRKGAPLEFETLFRLAMASMKR